VSDADDLAIQRRDEDIAALGLDDLAGVLDVTTSAAVRRVGERSSFDQLEDQWRVVGAAERIARPSGWSVRSAMIDRC
jgi:hypothetical protein